MEISHLRKEYSLFKLSLSSLRKEPLEQLKVWMKDAVDYKLIEPTAMVLATADNKGVPTTRVVLLKEIHKKGLIFFTNLESKKAHDLSENPYASATIYWKELERQVSIFGICRSIPKKSALPYFKSRPRASQISAWASKQGAKARSRAEIEEAFAEEEKKWEGRDVLMPPFWGGFMLIPQEVSFWQGREKRLHDRFLYQKKARGWAITRLYP